MTRTRSGSIVIALSVWLVIGCGSSSTTAGNDVATDTLNPDAQNDMQPADGVADLSAKDVVDASNSATNLRGVRYCEVLLAFTKNGAIEAQVYNTFPLNLCPDEQWEKLDGDTIKAENSSLFVVLNGPRYWLLNSIKGEQTTSGEKKTFGDLEMHLVAVVLIDPATVNNKPYTERTVVRTTEFTFNAGETVYQLISPTSEIYTMQSYSRIVDPTLDESALAKLDTRLQLPADWKYQVVKLDAKLVIKAVGTATVVQDEFQNTYQKIE